MAVNVGQQSNLANYDPVPEISRKHFEEALKTARKSVTNIVKPYKFIKANFAENFLGS